MRYVGGKYRIRKWIAPILLEVGRGCHTYLEPFVGSGAIFATVSPSFKKAIASDIHPDLMMMWKALAEGWVPPDWVSKEEYYSIKKQAPSALRSFVGFGSSFSGKWFGGYADVVWDEYHKRYTKPYLITAKTSVLKIVPAFQRAIIKNQNYDSFHPKKGWLVYCDPPYEGTLGYGGSGKFDSVAFWKVMDWWNESGAIVIVSEAKCPAGWKVLAERTRKAMLRVANGTENKMRIEKLFWKGKA